MAKVTGLEKPEELPEKVKLLYGAVLQLLGEGCGPADITVSDITGRAGIGKGTAYDYFDSKEDIIVNAVIFLMGQILGKLAARLENAEGFPAQVECLLDWALGSPGDRKFSDRFLQIFTDQTYSGLLCRKVRERPLEPNPLAALIKRMVEEAAERGEVRADLPSEYVVNTICSRLLGLVAFRHLEEGGEEKLALIRPYVCRGILDEFCQKV